MKLDLKNNQEMPLYEGTKRIYAKPMSRGKYNKYRGWKAPKDEDPKELGYLVEYTNGTKINHKNHKGYISWSPAPVFENYYFKITKDTHKTTGLVDFGTAIKALKEGKRVARQGWNGKGLFICMQVPADIGKEIVPNMQSLPQSVKDEFAKRFKNQGSLIDIRYRNQLIMVYPDNTIYGWVASPSDVLEEDWNILKN